MTRQAEARTVIELAPEAALGLWSDAGRWPTFVEGFARTLELSPEWPAEGAKHVWESIPGGRGVVTEKVIKNQGYRFVTQVYEDALTGEQSLAVAADEEGSRVSLSLSYELNTGGPLRAVTDVIFIRRALRDALGRTLRRFAIEAAEESTG